MSDYAVFLAVCKARGLPEPVTEYVFARPRKFRFDLAFVSQKIAVECEGGVFTRGAHGSVSGILRDIQKYNLAAVNGWLVIRVLPSNLICAETFEMIERAMKARSAA